MQNATIFCTMLALKDENKLSVPTREITNNGKKNKAVLPVKFGVFNTRDRIILTSPVNSKIAVATKMGFLSIDNLESDFLILIII